MLPEVGRCLAVSFACALIGCSPLVLAIRPPVDIDDYRGDGVIARIPNPINPGFRVDYDSFLLNTPFACRYDISHLPRPRHHSPYQVALVVDLTAAEEFNWPLAIPTWLKTAGVGVVTVRVYNRSGVALVNTQTEVSDLYWQSIDELPYGVPATIRDACRDKWLFPSHYASEGDQAPDVLVVEYRPGPGAVARSARFRLLAGGLE